MFELTLGFLDDLRGAFRIVDAVDILIVSVFLYAAIVWFQRTASRGVLIGFATLAAVYFAARGLDMYLTSLAFHTTFAVLLFILVVVFQEDLRRLLERIANLAAFRMGRASHAGFESDALVESVFKMAANKAGALIVLKSKEPLTRHLHGGITLNGQFSPQLLFSIFDSSTPGHDGAVVMDGDRVTQFATHLPISQNSAALSGRGTRHSAALGISERSDSLTIVVSEERGVVSVAESGTLSVMNTAADLKQRLDRFQMKSSPAMTSPSLKRLLIQNGRAKMSAVLIAVVAWFVLAYDPHTVQRTFVFPIEYRNLTNALELDTSAPSECRVTLSGAERHFRFLEPGNVKVKLDLSNLSPGFHEIEVGEADIRLPANLVPYRIIPRNIRLYLRPPDPPASQPPATAKREVKR